MGLPGGTPFEQVSQIRGHAVLMFLQPPDLSRMDFEELLPALPVFQPFFHDQDETNARGIHPVTEPLPQKVLGNFEENLLSFA